MIAPTAADPTNAGKAGISRQFVRSCLMIGPLSPPTTMYQPGVNQTSPNYDNRTDSRLTAPDTPILSN